MGPQTFGQPYITRQARTDLMSFYSPNMVVNTSDNPQIMNSMNSHPGLSQYPPGMMNRPQVQQQHQMVRMPTTPNRMMTPLNVQTPQLSANRYQTPFQTYPMEIYNHLPNPGSSSIGQNFIAAEAVRTNINRPFLSPYGTPYLPYNTSSTPDPYQRMATMMYDSFYPSASNFSGYQVGQSDPTANRSVSTYSAGSGVISSTALSHQQQVDMGIRAATNTNF